MKFTNRRIANTIIISTLLVASIASIGFSSWLIGNNESKSDINVEVGDVLDFDYKSSVFYIKNSEEGLSSYKIQDNDVTSGMFFDTNFSLKIKVNPTYVLKNFGEEEDVKCIFGLKYSVRTINYFNLFSGSSYVEPPLNYICKVDKNSSRYVLSDNLVQESNEINGITTSILKGEVSLYKLYGRSLYSITKDYSLKESDYIYLSVIFPFKINDSLYTKIKDYEIKFITSVGGVIS